MKLFAGIPQMDVTRWSQHVNFLRTEVEWWWKVWTNSIVRCRISWAVSTSLNNALMIWISLCDLGWHSTPPCSSLRTKTPLKERCNALGILVCKVGSNLNQYSVTRGQKEPTVALSWNLKLTVHLVHRLHRGSGKSPWHRGEVWPEMSAHGLKPYESK